MFRLTLTIFYLAIFCLFDNTLAYAWNPDYAYHPPKQRRMCAYRDSAQTVRFYTIGYDEDCPQGQRRYVVAFGRDPYGSMALFRTKTAREYFPPLDIEWPANLELSHHRLWHFTCVSHQDKQVFDSKINLLRYHGEITASGKEECTDVEERALNYCQKRYRGEFLLESCLLAW